MTAAERPRLQHHVDVMMPKACALDGSYITSIDKNPNYSQSGPLIPTLTKKDKVVSLKSDGSHMIATPTEHLIFQGEALADAAASDDYPCYFKALVSDGKLTYGQMKEMAGNSYHMLSMGQFMFYCLSSLTPA